MNRFTYPFCYTPAPEIVAAARRIIARIDACPELRNIFREGKMMGVLMVEDKEGQKDFLYGFSGLAGGRSTVEGFVPPIFDLTDPDGHFRKEEAGISGLNRRIRESSDPEEAAELLCRPYSLTGTVVTGKREGHLLGYPTANIQPYARKALPAYGVHTCQLETAEDSRPAVVNIGVTPTLPSGRVTVEAYALTGHPDLYGRKVRLTLLSMLRRETKFENPEELVRQIDKDRDEALRFFDMA